MSHHAPPPLVITIVVGAHPHAERDDRQRAYALAAHLEAMLAALHDTGESLPQVQVLSDLWFLNDASLSSGPTIALGTATTNAAVAHLASRLPQAFVVDGEFEIQFDRIGSDPRVSLRGVNAATTARAVEVFTDKFLAQWLEAVTAAV